MGYGGLGSHQRLYTVWKRKSHYRCQTPIDGTHASHEIYAITIRRKMLTAAYIVSFLGMIVLPIILWIYFRRKFTLSWKLILAGGLTFIASQILHIPLVLAMGSFLKSTSLVVNAVILGLLAGVFEETARYILFKLMLKNSRSWKEGVLVGLGHGGTESVILGILAALAFVNMIDR